MLVCAYVCVCLYSNQALTWSWMQASTRRSEQDWYETVPFKRRRKEKKSATANTAAGIPLLDILPLLRTVAF